MLSPYQSADEPGDLAGIVLAEVELDREDQDFDSPNGSGARSQAILDSDYPPEASADGAPFCKLRRGFSFRRPSPADARGAVARAKHQGNGPRRSTVPGSLPGRSDLENERCSSQNSCIDR